MTEKLDLPGSITAPRKRMAIFRRADAVDLDAETMPFEGMDAEGIQEGFAKMMAVGAEHGAAERTLVLFREAQPDGLSLTYAWFKSGYVLPKHSHNADCLYYVIAGSLRMGTQVLGKGDGLFIPADDAYTYEVGEEGLELLEFRNASRFNIVFKGNEPTHWDKMAATYMNRAAIWQAETTPPSERQKV
jgi:quercetin dioxygenase-like cupin family protein